MRPRRVMTDNRIRPRSPSSRIAQDTITGTRSATGLKKTVDWYLKNEMWWLPLRLKTYSGERLGLIKKSAAA